MKKILLVDDDPLFLRSLREALVIQGYDVYLVDGAEKALEIFDETFSAIVSDIQMEGMTGVDLLKEIRRRCSVPFFLVTGFSQLLQTQTAYDLGATDFLFKPFNIEDLIGSLELAFSGVPIRAESEDANYCAIGIEEFSSGSILPTDLYIRLGSGTKYLKVARINTTLPAERMYSYKEKGLTHFYVTKEDFPSYVSLNIKLVKAAFKTKGLDQTKKFHLLRHTTEAIIQDSYLNGLDKQKFHMSKVLLESTLNLISQDGEALDLLDMLRNHSNADYAHSVAVSMYAPLIAKEMNLTAQSTMFRLSMGGMFHDIGKKEIPKEVARKPRHLLSADERLLYESHPKRGKEIMMAMDWVPAEIMDIAAHHHENVLGSGFPGGLSKARIHPLAKIVSVANEFAKLSLNYHNKGSSLEPKESIDRILQDSGQQFDTTALYGLMLLFDYPAPVELAAKAKNRISSLRQ